MTTVLHPAPRFASNEGVNDEKMLAADNAEIQNALDTIDRIEKTLQDFSLTRLQFNARVVGPETILLERVVNEGAGLGEDVEEVVGGGVAEGQVEVVKLELPRTRLSLMASDHLPLVAELRVKFE